MEGREFLRVVTLRKGKLKSAEFMLRPIVTATTFRSSGRVLEDRGECARFRNGDVPIKTTALPRLLLRF